MPFQDSLNTIRAFFRWMAQSFRVWFLPYHSDENEEETAEAAQADTVPDRSPKPSPSAEPSTSPTETTSETYPESATATESGVSTEPLSEIQSEPARVMAFRGATTKTALAAILGQDSDQVGEALGRLLETGVVDDLGEGRYLLRSDERRQILRADQRVSDWLARLNNTQMEDEILDVLEELSRQLALRITVGKTLVLHLRQRVWMIWKSQEDSCRVRILSRLTSKQWSRIRQLDEKAKRFRGPVSQPTIGPNWVLFRWRAGADVEAVKSVLGEIGREFQQRVRHRSSRGRKPPTSSH